MQININEKEIQETIQTQLTKDIKAFVNDRVTAKIRAMFYDCRKYGGRKMNVPDEGYFVNLIEAAMTEVVLDPKWEQMIKDQIEKQMPEAIETAVKLRCEHEAKKKAFTDGGENVAMAR